MLAHEQGTGMSDADEIDLGLGHPRPPARRPRGRRCGKVDDLELEGVATGEPRVAAILVGPRAWRGRGRSGGSRRGSRAAAVASRGSEVERSTRPCGSQAGGRLGSVAATTAPALVERMPGAGR